MFICLKHDQFSKQGDQIKTNITYKLSRMSAHREWHQNNKCFLNNIRAERCHHVSSQWSLSRSMSIVTWKWWIFIKSVTWRWEIFMLFKSPGHHLAKCSQKKETAAITPVTCQHCDSLSLVHVSSLVKFLMCSLEGWCAVADNAEELICKYILQIVIIFWASRVNSSSGGGCNRNVFCIKILGSEMCNRF